jgi:hypothetical protein
MPSTCVVHDANGTTTTYLGKAEIVMGDTRGFITVNGTRYNTQTSLRQHQLRHTATEHGVFIR